jgi:hypothetical protein
MGHPEAFGIGTYLAGPAPTNAKSSQDPGTPLSSCTLPAYPKRTDRSLA